MGLIKSLAVIGFALYGILLIGFGWITINLDNKGTNELPIQSWTELMIVAYVLALGAIFFISAFRIINGGRNVYKHNVWLPVLVLIFHGLYFFYNAEGEMVFYLSMLHIPLIIGVFCTIALIIFETRDNSI
jgi:hypothetical protein